MRDAVAAGRLVRLLDDWCPTYPGAFVYYPGRRQQPPSLAALVEFVKEFRRSSKSANR